MISIKLLMLVLFIGDSISVPRVNIEIKKSSFLFIIKWANFNPVSILDVNKTVSGSGVSKWYITADYFGKLTAKEPEYKIIVQCKINDATEYKDYKDIESLLNSEGDKLTLAVPSFEAACKSDDSFKADVVAVDLDGSVFNVSLNVSCTPANAVSEIKEGEAPAKSDEVAPKNEELISQTEEKQPDNGTGNPPQRVL